jgi:phosphatidylserine synthase
VNSGFSGDSGFQVFLEQAAYVFLILSAVCTVIMLVSLFRCGDERRKYILGRTCTHTFLIYTGVLAVDVIYTVFFEKYSHLFLERSPVLALGFIAVVFTISLFLNKRKSGN